ncbi:MAG: hydantoinase/oxoprolinase N-terminal domain-containing protein, partial [Pseudomonadota bacterium]
MSDSKPSTQWRFWIDRGGTFTDIVAQQGNGVPRLVKLLSENPEQYTDAALAGIRQVMGVPDPHPLPTQRIAHVKMGTTV